MAWLFRLGMYLAGGLAAWQFLQGVGPDSVLPAKSLALDSAHGMIFGVCAGVSNYTGVDVTIIRLLWAVASFYRGAGVALYLLAFLIMPASLS